MHLSVKIISSVLLTILVISCTPEHSKIVVANYDDSQITMGEFEKAYSKNVGGYEAAANDSFVNYKNFADLYVNFKMKLKDADYKNFANNPELKNELLDYKKKVGSSYFLERYLVEPNIKDWYEKRKIEIRASHLMIRPDASGEETARQLAQSILDSIKNGKSFEDMVSKYSQDQFSKPKAGDIFYFTAGQLPYEFEDACYKTDSGKVYPQVVQTKFGFHIIKVTDKKPRVAKIKASHILVSFMKPDGTVDTAAAKLTMDSVLAELRAGNDFAKVAAKYSDDTGTKDKGGDLGFFERRMMVQAFDEAAFKLNVGEISGVVESGYGYHVIKLTEKQPYPSFDEDRENLKNIFKKSRYNDVYAEMIEKLKKEYNYKLNDNVIQQIVGYNDTTLIGGDLSGAEEIGGTAIFTFAKHNETVNSFYNSLRNDNEFTGKKFVPDILNKAAKKYSEQLLLEEKALHLDSTDTQFADLMKDYESGIFIFKLQEDEVWNKVKIDSTKLVAFYEKTKQNYVWPDRISYTEIFAKKDSVIKHYYSLLKEGENFDTLAAKTERVGLKDRKGKYDLQVIGSTEFSKNVNELQNVGDYTAPIPNPGGFSILRLDKKDHSRIKTFEEARAEVSGAFQESESKRLEKEYIDSLKSKYSPVINYEELQNAFKSKTN